MMVYFSQTGRGDKSKPQWGDWLCTEGGSRVPALMKEASRLGAAGCRSSWLPFPLKNR